MAKKRRKEDIKKLKARRKKRSFFVKIINSFIAVVSISALILFIVVFIGKISELDKTTFDNVLSKIFTNLDKNEVLKSTGSLGSGVIDDYLPFDTDNNELLFKICLISDIHEDEENLKKALEKISLLGCDRLFVLGDLTNYGDIESLKKIRDVLNSSGVEYYALPGDHDIADSLSPENFNEVFGINYHIMEYKGQTFLLIDNSANYTEIGSIQMSWIEKNIGDADFVVMSQPLYTEGLNPPFVSIYMGRLLSQSDDDTLRKKQQYVKEQGELLLDIIRKNDNIKAIIAGDHHRSSEIEDSVRESLHHYVVGAVTSTVNDYPQAAIQSPRFSTLSVYEEGKYIMEDVLID
jgi:predicted phosphodiesterase